MSVTNYVWLGENVLYETDENDAVTVEYTYEPQQYGRLLSEYRDSTTYTHYYDALGSTLALTDSTGTVTDTFTYTAWGEELTRTGTTPTPFRWLGKIGYYFDSRVSQVWVRSRMYDSSIGLWNSVDPVFSTKNYCPFIYVLNNPVNRLDPSGREVYGYDDDDPKGKEIAEIGAYVKTPLNQYAVAVCAEGAKSYIEGMPGRHGGQADAIRHCIWTCCMSAAMDKSTAIGVADIHEKYVPPPENFVPEGFKDSEEWRRFDAKMDKENNSFGAGLADACICRIVGYCNCNSWCEDAFKKGELTSFGVSGYIKP